MSKAPLHKESMPETMYRASRLFRVLGNPTAYLVKGHIRVRIGDAWHDTRAGDSWCIPMNVVHGAEILEDAVAVEVFSPARQDYLPKDRSGADATR
jgi:hypothetical protein